MILNIYSAIGEILSQGLPEKELWIDLDRGQLRHPKLFESLILPSILISFEDGIDWESSTQKFQLGEVKVSLKVIVRLPEPIFLNTRFNNNLEALSLEDDVHLAFVNKTNANRIKTKSYPVDTLFVVEHTYITSYDYEPTPPDTINLGDLTLKTTLQILP